MRAYLKLELAQNCVKRNGCNITRIQNQLYYCMTNYKFFFLTHDKLQVVKLKKCATIVKLNINTEAVKDSDISYLSVHMGERNNLFEKLLLNFAITLLFFILTILTNKSSNLIYIITQVNQSKMLKKNVTAAKITKTLHWYAAYFNTAMTN
jgi:hypothetical protein